MDRAELWQNWGRGIGTVRAEGFGADRAKGYVIGIHWTSLHLFNSI
uniref:Uncharacterized protein n=1 Tax=Moniliophthora roreri TaxID=221103 RepID=A0A0W0F668_MONRR